MFSNRSKSTFIRRSSKRAKIDDNDADESKQRTIPRINPRTAVYCMQFGMPRRLICSGCSKFCDAGKFPIDVDSCGIFDGNLSMIHHMHQLLAKRQQTHTDHTFQCRQPWNWEEGTYEGTKDELWISHVKSFINTNHGHIHSIGKSTTRQQPKNSSTMTMAPPTMPHTVPTNTPHINRTETLVPTHLKRKR